MLSRIGFFLLLGLNLFMAYNFFLGQNGLQDYLQRKELKRELQQELEQTEDKNMQLSQKIRLLQNDTLYLEKVVRSELHFVQESEVLYVVSDLEQKSAAGP
ncbi:MAG: septum formation initiator family protein [Desulfohalobiaceae bacterium]